MPQQNKNYKKTIPSLLDSHPKLPAPKMYYFPPPASPVTEQLSLVIRSLEAGNVRRKVHVVNLLAQLTIAGCLWPTGHHRVRQGLLCFLCREPIAVRHEVELEPIPN